jgi:hypothetical protein
MFSYASENSDNQRQSLFSAKYSDIFDSIALEKSLVCPNITHYYIIPSAFWKIFINLLSVVGIFFN